MDPPPEEASSSSSSWSVSLSPFLHQVGGHFPMVTLGGERRTVCKPLNEREHRFYTTMPNVLKPYTPAYEGTMKVEASEDEEGYILLRGHPPPSYYCQQQQQQQQDQVRRRSAVAAPVTTSPISAPPPPPAPPSSASASASASGLCTPTTPCQTHYRLKRKGKIEMEAFSVEDPVSPPSNASLAVASSLPSSSEIRSAVQAAADQMKRSEEHQMAFYNPWALKCHRDHLKKLGLLRPPSSSSEQSSANANHSSTTSDKNKRQSRSNPQMYLLLENLVSKYDRPCVLDLKVGARQYADDVSAAKKQRKIAKANSTTLGEMGLRLCGMQVYSRRTGRYTCRNKYYGRQLTPSGLRAAIRQFFRPDEGEEGGRDEANVSAAPLSFRSDVLDQLVCRLRDLRRVIRGLESFRFYTSSLLLTYDAAATVTNNSSKPVRSRERSDSSINSGDEEVLLTSPPAGSGESEEDTTKVDLRVIDFANSTHFGLSGETGGVTHEGPDEGFVFGLDTLLEIMAEIREGKGGMVVEGEGEPSLRKEEEEEEDTFVGGGEEG